MSIKLVAFVAFVAVVQAGKLSYVAAPVSYVAHEPSAPAHYDYGYTVSDPHTGDQKSQKESRRGDVVHGSYSLVDADGTKRTVEYSADAHNGFNAVVHKETAVVAPVVAKIAAPVAVQVPYAVSAPVVSKYTVAAPAYTVPSISYAAPAPIVANYAAAPSALSYLAPAPVAGHYYHH